MILDLELLILRQRVALAERYNNNLLMWLGISMAANAILGAALILALH
jgi:hypothetical protein